MSGFVKIEEEEYESIPNLTAEIKQERMNVNVNYNRREKYESIYWQQKCEDLEQKVRRLENENTSLKTKKTPSSSVPNASASAPYSDPLLKAFFCPKLPETELDELRKEKEGLIAKLAKMKDKNLQVGFQIRNTIHQSLYVGIAPSANQW